MKNNISSENIKECILKYGVKFGGFLKEILGESLTSIEEKIFCDAINIGIENTIAALYDADIEDEKIIELLNKYWGINYREATERLAHEKRQALKRVLK